MAPCSAGAGHFAHGEQARQAGAAVQVHVHPAAEVVGGRHHRDQLAAGSRPASRQGPAPWGSAPPGPACAWSGARSRYMQTSPVAAISWKMARLTTSRGRQLHAFGRVPGHEALPVAVHQVRALAAQGLGEQGARLARHEQGGGVELHVLAVDDPGVGPVGRGQAVAGGRGGVAGVQVEVAQAAGGQHGALGQAHAHLAVGLQQVGAVHLDGIVDRPGVAAVVRHGRAGPPGSGPPAPGWRDWPAPFP